MKPIKPQTFKSEPFSLGLECDRELGEIVADAKLQATQDGFTDRYHQGVDSFWREQGISAKDKTIGEAIALALLSERQKVLQQIIIRTLLFGIPGLLAALLIGVKPEQSAIAFIPAGAIALYSTQK